MASKEKFVEPMKKSYSVSMWWIGTPARSRVPEKESALR